MSDLLIKGVEMPKSCRDCKAFVCYKQWAGDMGGCFCGITKEDAKAKEKNADCPLVSVPPHGDLIDRDALVTDLKRQCKEVFKIDAVSHDDFWITRNEAYNESLWKTWCESFFEYLKTRETIIPAEEGE